MKHTRQDLKIMQGWSLERKIRVTQTRIMEWYMRYDGQVFISFSGGKDSTVLLDLARRVYPDIPAVYVDTGLEYPELRDFVKTKDNVIWLRPRYPFTQILEKYGYPIISKEVSDVINGARKGHLLRLHLYVAMLLLLETVSFGLHQEKWMALSCMPTLYSMKTGRSSHGMNRKI